MTGLLVISTLVLLVLYTNSCFARFSCKKDGGGSDVDWFIALKLPQLPSKHQFKREGTAYVYMDSENAGNGFKLSSYSVTDERSAMGATLKTVYDTAQSQSYNSFVRLFYNDQPPFYKDPRITKNPTSSYGHSKGAIAYDTNGGFWLIHSAPRYPGVTRSKYTYPRNGKKNGQAFFCANFNIQTFNKIAEHLLYVRPFIYDFNLPPNMKRRDTSSVTQLIENINVKRLEIYPPKGSGRQNDVKFTLSTLKGTNLFSYAKNKVEFGLINHIANNNLVRLYAETWVHGRSYASGSVMNVKQVIVLGDSYSSSKDHSKYLVAERVKRKNVPQIYLVCIGDLNRMTSQLKRGGGYLCIKDISVWEAFFKIVDPVTQPNPKRPKVP